MKPAPKKLDLDTLSRVPEMLERACGVTLAVGNAQFLRAAVEAASTDSALQPFDFLRKLEEGDEVCIRRLVDHAVVGETYFFRHREHFLALRKHLLREFGRDEKISAWCAGCATGEEPYSLAMTLIEAGYSPDRAHILATDVSSKAITRARTAEYGSWSFRRVDAVDRERFFEGTTHSRPIAAVRKLVEFRRHNLIKEPPPDRGFHVIFCRNVLIYFVPQTVKRVLCEMADALRPGGLLFLSTTEIAMASLLKFEAVKLEGGTVLRKPVARLRSHRSSAPVKEAPARGVVHASRQGASRPNVRLQKTASGPSAEHPPSEKKRREHPHPRAIATHPDAPRGSRFREALEAARQGRIEDAEVLARESGTAELTAEAFLLLSMIAESKDDLSTAVAEARRALYLAPSLAQAHAALAGLFARLGLTKEAKRARHNALSVIDGLPDEALLPGVEDLTAGALRRALAGTNPSTARKLRRP